jgi:hypothetical protein
MLLLCGEFRHHPDDIVGSPRIGEGRRRARPFDKRRDATLDEVRSADVRHAPILEPALLGSALQNDDQVAMPAIGAHPLHNARNPVRRSFEKLDEIAPGADQGARDVERRIARPSRIDDRAHFGVDLLPSQIAATHIEKRIQHTAPDNVAKIPVPTTGASCFVTIAQSLLTFS